MIQGTVSANRDPVVRLRFIGRNGHTEDVDAVVDTGFQGFMTLPPDLIARLGFPVGIPTGVTVAGGTFQPSSVVVATVEWDGQTRQVSALLMANEVLVGMALLDGYRLTVEAAIGGRVLIEQHP